MTNKEIENEFELFEGGGLIGSEEQFGSDTDYIINDSQEAIDTIKKQTVSGSRSYYNQGALYDTRNYCTIYAPCGAVGDLMGFTFTNEQIKAIGDKQVKEGLLDPSVGGYAYDGVDAVRHAWNEMHTEEEHVKSYRLTILSAAFWEAMKNGHRVVIGLNVVRDYVNDSQDDGIVQGDSYPGRQGGHLTTCFMQDGKVYVGDSYAGKKKYNIYEVETFIKLAESRMYYGNTYLFLKSKNDYMSEQEKNNAILKEAEELGYWNGQDSEQPMKRREVMLVVMRLREDLLSQQTVVNNTVVNNK